MSDIFQNPKIYYDIKINRFRAYRSPAQDGHILTSGAKYYSDTQNSERTVQQLSDRYFQLNMVEVGNIDEFEFAQMREDGAWRVIDLEKVG